MELQWIVLVRFIMVSGKMIRDQDGLGIKMLMESNILVSGRIIKKAVTKSRDSMIKILAKIKTMRKN
jgi:hypothetical protein